MPFSGFLVPSSGDYVQWIFGELFNVSMGSVSLCEVRMDLGAVACWSGLRQRSGELGLGGTEVWGVVLVELATEAA